MTERTLTYFVSDVHLGLDVADPDAREARFVSFLRSIPADRTSALYLLGDIWDFWYEYEDVVPKGYVRVFAALTDLMDAGVRVYFFRGNHDIWTYGYLASLGITVLAQPHLVKIGSETFCLGHGDGLGPGMCGYKIMQWTFRAKFFQRLFSLLHPWIAYRLGKGWSRSSRLARRGEYVFRGEEEPLYKFAEDYSSETHVDYFVFGHYHTHVDMTLSSGSRLIVLKDWISSSPYLCYNSGAIGTIGYSPNMDQ